MEEIKQSQADIIFVALPTPEKEEFLYNYEKALNIPICHGVGGSFDVVAGKVKRAPVWMQHAGLEWLYRLLREPRRLGKYYLITNGTFVILVFGKMVQRLAKKITLLWFPTNFPS